jgi:serine/threonine-protein kinase
MTPGSPWASTPTRLLRHPRCGRTGRTGEVFAFDDRAVLLSESRFVAELLAPGRIPDEHGRVLSPRGPGAGLGAAQAMLATRLSREALGAGTDSARSGVILDPYESDRGARVIGAWRWLPAAGLGVAVEVGAEEAYAPLAVLNVAFGLIFGALVLGLTASLLYVLWLKRQIGEAHRLGAYVLERKIGEGGMANVYLAHHALLRRPTAVKILKPEHSAGAQFIARFEREVKLASQLSHPNTVEIYDYGRTPDGQFYFAMEYLDGIELMQLVKEAGPISVARTVYLLRQVCASSRAHAGAWCIATSSRESHDLPARRRVRRGESQLRAGRTSPSPTRGLTRTIRFSARRCTWRRAIPRSRRCRRARRHLLAQVVAFYLLTGKELFEGADDLELSNRVLNDPAPRPSTVASQSIPMNSTCWSRRA